MKLTAILFFILLTSCTTSADKSDPRLRSANFKDGKFHNTGATEPHSFFDYLKMRLTTPHADWPEWVETSEDEAPIERITGPELRVTFINHATFLIQTAGVNILTDPVFSKRVSPVSFAGPKRVHKPGIRIEKLPKIDIVLISHDHYDHLDTSSIQFLIKRDNPELYMGLGVGKRLKEQGQFIEMDWWETVTAADQLKITFAEVQHFSGRSLTDRNSTLWGGFVLETGGKKIYFGGDSGYAGHYKKTYQKFGAMDLAFIPIGAYAPREFMSFAHLDPKQAVQAHKELKSKKSVGMHYGCFQLTAESIEEPQKLLEEEKLAANIGLTEFVTLPQGKAAVF